MVGEALAVTETWAPDGSSTVVFAVPVSPGVVDSLEVALLSRIKGPPMRVALLEVTRVVADAACRAAYFICAAHKPATWPAPRLPHVGEPPILPRVRDRGPSADQRAHERALRRTEAADVGLERSERRRRPRQGLLRGVGGARSGSGPATSGRRPRPASRLGRPPCPGPPSPRKPPPFLKSLRARRDVQYARHESYWAGQAAVPTR